MTLFCWWDALQLTRHAADKLETYGIAGERLASWRAALSSGEPFLDVSTGARGLVIRWEARPWIVILREDEMTVVTTYPSDERTVKIGPLSGLWRWPVDLSQHLTVQLKEMERLVDPATGAILFRHPTLRGIPDLVVEGDGYTLEFIGPTLLCLDIQDPSGMARLLAEPVKAQLPIGV